MNLDIVANEILNTILEYLKLDDIRNLRLVNKEIASPSKETSSTSSAKSMSTSRGPGWKALLKLRRKAGNWVVLWKI